MTTSVMTREFPTDEGILWIDGLGRGNIPQVGGKGANLGELRSAQIPVPNAFVVTKKHYLAFLRHNNLRLQGRRLLAGLNIHDNTQLQISSKLLMDMHEKAEMPPEVVQEIYDSCRQLGPGPYAVRSSFVLEDVGETSAAGQAATFLNVKDAAGVVAKVKSCWASLFEARAIFYRAENNQDHFAGMGVPVQLMAPNEISWIMFTADPTTSDRSRILIDTGYGLGEAFVSGEQSPESHTVAHTDALEILDTVPSAQTRMLRRRPDADQHPEEPNEWLDVPADLIGKPVLRSADDIRKLAALGRAVEEFYGFPQDLEGTARYREDGELELWVVQSRPITTLDKVKDYTDTDTGNEPAPVLAKGQKASPGIAYGIVRFINDPSDLEKVQPGDILVADMTKPDMVPAMKRAGAIITARGGRLCHAAVVSRELGVPCIVGAANVMERLTEGNGYTVDALRGNVHEGRAETRLDFWALPENRDPYKFAANYKTVTKIFVNIGDPDEAVRIAERNVSGIGLLRAEFIVDNVIMMNDMYAAADPQRAKRFVDLLTESLEKAAAAFYPRPIVYRLKDDRSDEGEKHEGQEFEFPNREDNPMIGLHGALRYVRMPHVLDLQIDAILRVREKYNNLHVMVPFVRKDAELAVIKEHFEDRGLVAGKDNFLLWMMCEVPANRRIKRYAAVGINGISWGTNDWLQLNKAVDRNNEVFEAFNETDPDILDDIFEITQDARKNDLTVSVCGQGPSDFQVVTVTFVKAGATSISAQPDAINKVRAWTTEAEAALLGVSVEEYQERYDELSLRLLNRFVDGVDTLLTAAN